MPRSHGLGIVHFRVHGHAGITSSVLMVPIESSGDHGDMDRDTIRRLTDLLRTSADSPYPELRELLAERGIAVDSTALADLHAEGERLWWVTVVTSEGRAYLGDLRSSPEGSFLHRWREVPSRAIDDRAQLAQVLNANRRARRPWNDGMPGWVRSPDDFLYNGEIQEGLAFLGHDPA